MFASKGDAGIHGRAGAEIRPGLLGRILECKVWKQSSGAPGVWDRAVVEVCAGPVDHGDDWIVKVWGILFFFFFEKSN